MPQPLPSTQAISSQPPLPRQRPMQQSKRRTVRSSSEPATTGHQQDIAATKPLVRHVPNTAVAGSLLTCSPRAVIKQVQDFMYKMVDQDSASPRAISCFTHDTIASYPDIHQTQVRVGIIQQLPKLLHAKAEVLEDLDDKHRKAVQAELRSQRAAITVARRKDRYYQYLDSAWGSRRAWLPKEHFPRESPGLNIANYIRRITITALRHNAPLPSLWSPGGVLYEAVHSQDKPMLSARPLAAAAQAYVASFLSSDGESASDPEVDTPERSRKASAAPSQSILALGSSPFAGHTPESAEKATPEMHRWPASPAPRLSKFPADPLDDLPSDSGRSNGDFGPSNATFDDSGDEDYVSDVGEGPGNDLGVSADKHNVQLQHTEAINAPTSLRRILNSEEPTSLPRCTVPSLPPPDYEAGARSPALQAPATLGTGALGQEEVGEAKSHSLRHQLSPQPEVLNSDDDAAGQNDRSSRPNDLVAIETARAQLKTPDARLVGDTIWALIRAIAPDKGTLSRRRTKIMDPLYFKVALSDSSQGKTTGFRNMKHLRHVYIPIHHQGGGGHWTFAHMHISQTEGNSDVLVRHFDSLPDSDRSRLVRREFERLASEVITGSRVVFEEVVCPRQKDGDNCGIFVVALFERVISGTPIPDTIHPTQERRRLLQLLTPEPTTPPHRRLSTIPEESFVAQEPSSFSPSLVPSTHQHPQIDTPTPAPWNDTQSDAQQQTKPCTNLANAADKRPSRGGGVSTNSGPSSTSSPGEKKRRLTASASDPTSLKRQLLDFVKNHTVDRALLQELSSRLAERSQVESRLRQEAISARRLAVATRDDMRHKERQLLDAKMIESINEAMDNRLDASENDSTSEHVRGALFNIAGHVRYTMRQAGWGGVSSSEAQQQFDAAESAWRHADKVASTAETRAQEASHRLETMRRVHREQQQLQDLALAAENLDLSSRFVKSSDVQALMAEDD
ncbi:hypothetical protein CTA1_11869 [Colletotrichum tanaceti]|uniref:Ubiquitin-like protease family profile domain-containing protein n=1 Tax=Colletotrichum tanaceti TaxID=1306861 RepID=A0A4U6XHV0_9PEZI|nr:hypothetical protein CTA1_11869 [Colletotrichum tanaceti]